MQQLFGIASVSLLSLVMIDSTRAMPAGGAAQAADEVNGAVPPALLVVLAGLSASSDCLVEDSAFATTQGGCLDLATGLVWGTSTHDLGGNAIGNWQDAMTNCDELVEGGFSDWFLPSRTQALDVVAHGSATHLNIATSFLWWTSTTKGGQRAWAVNLFDGRVSDSIRGSLLPRMCVRWASATTPPNAPTGLVALPVGSNQINLVWIDQSADETSFMVDRSADGSTWSLIATLPPDSESYGDGSVAPGQEYSYRVWASNSGGASAYSNVVTITTAPGDSLAQSEMPVEGTVTGNFSHTWTDDGVYESITEIHTGGNPSQRRSLLEHKWAFAVASGSTVTLHVQAHRTDTGEGDTFKLAYAIPGVTDFIELPGVIAATVDNGLYETFALPAMQAGIIEIRVLDTNRLQGFGAQDVLHVDHMFITSL
jgi:hypothetical protein